MMAGEPESLDMDEPLPRRLQRHQYDRLLMLSDGVFAIAITLLALELRPPELWPGSLGALMVMKWRSLVGFGFGFVIVGAFWVAHRALFARLRRVDGVTTVLSLVLLALVSLAPAFAAVLTQYGPRRAFPLYLGLVASLFSTQAVLWAYAAYLGKMLHTDVDANGTGQSPTAIVLVGLVIVLNRLCTRLAALSRLTGVQPQPFLRCLRPSSSAI